MTLWRQMIDPALTQLIGLLMRGSVRRAWCSIKNPAGAFFVVFIMAMLLVGVGPAMVSAFSDQPSPSAMVSELIIQLLPVGMLLMTAALVATNSGESLLELRPAELQFVLAGPFSDSHILSYRLITLLISWIPLSAFFSLFILQHVSSYVGAFCGFVLSGAFIMLVVFQFALVKPKLSAISLRVIRWCALIVIGTVMVETLWAIGKAEGDFSPSAFSDAVNDGWIASVASVPFHSFSGVLASPVGWQLLIQIMVSLILLAIITCSCYWTNAGFAELAVEGVGRRIEKLQRIKGGNLYGVSTKRADRRPLLPAFPWLGGVGPVAWTQITSAVRRTGRLIPVVLILGVIAAVVAGVLVSYFPNVVPDDKRVFALPVALGVSFYVGFLVSMTAQTGFTANRRLLTWYQLLPVPPMAIATGMVAGTATPLVVIQIAVCLPAMVISTHSSITSISILFAGTALSVSFATVINAIAGAADLRPVPHGTPDVFQGAKGMVFMLVLGVSMFPVMLFAAGAVGIAWVLFGPSWSACAATMGITVFAIQPPLWWYSGRQFILRELSGE